MGQSTQPSLSAGCVLCIEGRRHDDVDNKVEGKELRVNLAVENLLDLFQPVNVFPRCGSEEVKKGGGV